MPSFAIAYQVLEFLHRVADIFLEYFGELDEGVIKDNFSTVYQLLEVAHSFYVSQLAFFLFAYFFVACGKGNDGQRLSPDH